MSGPGVPSGEFDELSDVIFRFEDLYQQFTEFTLESFPIMEKIEKADENRKYPVNSKGFRGPEFGKVDLLAAGCSQTFGMGVDEDQTWPHLAAKSLGFSYANLGIPGTSNQKIVESIILYVKEYGPPKAICVNFPSLYRFRFALRSDVLEYPHPKQPTPEGVSQPYVLDINMVTPGADVKPVKNWPKYSKRPYDISTSIPYESALYLSMMSINHLIEYCSVANIDLFFTTWYLDTNLILSEKAKRYKESLGTSSEYNKLDMSGYLELENLDLFFYHLEHEKCHKEEEENSGSNNWSVGTDTGRHMGAHQHMHYAEMFSDAIKKRKQMS
jgi:hypothetical protein